MIVTLSKGKFPDIIDALYAIYKWSVVMLLPLTFVLYYYEEVSTISGMFDGIFKFFLHS